MQGKFPTELLEKLTWKCHGKGRGLDHSELARNSAFADITPRTTQGGDCCHVLLIKAVLIILTGSLSCSRQYFWGW